jgi:hypothetical protein
MNTLKFEWDESKAGAKLKKHGVSFDEARTVFFDERAKLIGDPEHSEDEDRFISARKATASESKFYP